MSSAVGSPTSSLVATKAMFERRRLYDAVYAVALHRYIISRIDVGERVTATAAERIVEFAIQLGMQPTLSVRLHGFQLDSGYVRPLHADMVWSALDRIDRADARHLLRALCRRFEELSVAELECTAT